MPASSTSNRAVQEFCWLPGNITEANYPPSRSYTSMYVPSARRLRPQQREEPGDLIDSVSSLRLSSRQARSGAPSPSSGRESMSRYHARCESVAESDSYSRGGSGREVASTTRRHGGEGPADSAYSRQPRTFEGPSNYYPSSRSGAQSGELNSTYSGTTARDLRHGASSATQSINREFPIPGHQSYSRASSATLSIPREFSIPGHSSYAVAPRFDGSRASSRSTHHELSHDSGMLGVATFGMLSPPSGPLPICYNSDCPRQPHSHHSGAERAFTSPGTESYSTDSGYRSHESEINAIRARYGRAMDAVDDARANIGSIVVRDKNSDRSHGYNRATDHGLTTIRERESSLRTSFGDDFLATTRGRDSSRVPATTSSVSSFEALEDELEAYSRRWKADRKREKRARARAAALLT